MASQAGQLHLLLVLSDPQAAAEAARALRKRGMTVDVAMNARIASAMRADGSYDVVMFEHGLEPSFDFRRRSQLPGIRRCWRHRLRDARPGRLGVRRSEC
jgi:hypothetical protein